MYDKTVLEESNNGSLWVTVYTESIVSNEVYINKCWQSYAQCWDAEEGTLLYRNPTKYQYIFNIGNLSPPHLHMICATGALMSAEEEEVNTIFFFLVFPFKFSWEYWGLVLSGNPAKPMLRPFTGWSEKRLTVAWHRSLYLPISIDFPSHLMMSSWTATFSINTFTTTHPAATISASWISHVWKLAL